MLNTDRLCPACMNDNGGEKICGICGYDAAEKNGQAELPVRFMLADGRYMIGKALSSDYEGILYMGFDVAANQAVTVKEYFPSDIAVRNPDRTVSMASGGEFAYNEGLMDFLELNKKLSAFEEGALVKTYSVFEENGTAYRVNATFSGITLEDFLERNGGKLKWEQARPLFLPLIDTLAALHGERIIHSGISPETVLVGRDGKLRFAPITVPKRQRTKDGDTAGLHDGYSAAEQYGFENLEISFHTDVYALSATLFRVLIGTVPPKADGRLHNDSLTIPAHFADELPRQVLVSLANGLQVLPQKRTATVEQFKNELVYGETQENVRKSAAAAAKNSEKPSAKAQKKGSGAKYAAISAGCTAAVFILLAAILCLTVFRAKLFGGDTESVPEDVVSIPSRASIGDVDSDAVESKTLYSVPDLLGKYYSQIVNGSADNEEYERFTFVIKDKEFSDKYAKGMICAQSLEAGTSVEKETEIAITISLGPKEVKVPNVLGLDETQAKLEILKQGFLYENIEVVDMYDEDARPGVVLEQTPEYGTVASTEIAVRICINSYEGDGESTSSSSH